MICLIFWKLINTFNFKISLISFNCKSQDIGSTLYNIIWNSHQRFLYLQIIYIVIFTRTII
uniref:Uncharacterized protein n=1 Tax=Octopus bimaculoides TaxID=37653 RepID=A0A0L8GMV5_OCTBM